MVLVFIVIQNCLFFGQYIYLYILVFFLVPKSVVVRFEVWDKSFQVLQLLKKVCFSFRVKVSLLSSLTGFISRLVMLPHTITRQFHIFIVPDLYIVYQSEHNLRLTTICLKDQCSRSK